MQACREGPFPSAVGPPRPDTTSARMGDPFGLPAPFLQPTRAPLPQAGATAAFSGAYVFVGTVCRFRWPSLDLFFISHLIAVAMLVSVSYHQHDHILAFSRLWVIYCGIASGTSLLACSTVLPMTGGFVIRHALATGLEALGACVRGTLRLLCGEVDGLGLLRARSGDNISHFGMDSGLARAGLAEVHRHADVAAEAWTVSMAWPVFRRGQRIRKGFGGRGGRVLGV